jgi:hypothetical protein
VRVPCMSCGCPRDMPPPDDCLHKSNHRRYAQPADDDNWLTEAEMWRLEDEYEQSLDWGDD